MQKPSCLIPIGLLVLAACGADNTVTSRSIDASAAITNQAGLRAHKTLDDEFADLVDEVPGFGGMFYDSTGALTVYLKDLAGTAAARSRIAAFLGRRTKGTPERIAQIAAETGAMRARQARYDFRELLSLYRTYVISLASGASGVTMTDIDDAKNRIIIGVQNVSMLGPMRQALAGLPIPADAIEAVRWRTS